MKRIMLLTLAGLLVLGVGTSLAEITDTFHDIPQFTDFAQGGKGTCSFCHVPHGAQGAKLFGNAPAGTTLAWNDPLSRICWDCHSGTTVSSAENVNPFQTESHGKDVADLVTWGDVPPGTVVADLGLKKADTTNNQLYCVSCHSVHDNSVRPFLEDNGVVGLEGALAYGNLATLCDDCHIDRERPLSRTNHPTSTSWTNVSGRASVVTYAAANAVFKNSWAGTNTGRGSTAPSWNLGGKVVNIAGSDTDEFNCGTCHLVHSNETNVFDAPDADVPSAIWQNMPSGTGLIVLSDVPTTGPAAVAAICSACHDISDANSGPGGVALSYSHPYQAAWVGSYVDVPGNGHTIDGTPALEKGLSQSIIACQDCHDMHFARVSTAVNPTYALIRNECADCHNSSAGQMAEHHPANIVVAIGTDTRADFANDIRLTNQNAASGGLDYTAITNDAQVIDESTLGAARTASSDSYWFDTLGASYVMGCNTCHGGGLALAHNNTGTTGFPALAGPNDESQMCVDCHGFNPSVRTDNHDGATAKGQGAASNANEGATHYIGPISNTDNMWRGGAGSPATGLVAKISGDSANGSIICESCHSLYVNGKNLHVFVPQTSLNQAADYATNVPLMLVNSGNSRVPVVADDYLCTACHGVSPPTSSGGTGSHPVIPTLQTVASSGTIQGGVAAVAELTLAPGNWVNCESCHRPHDARTQSSTWILEMASFAETATGNQYLNETVLCGGCHVDKY